MIFFLLVAIAYMLHLVFLVILTILVVFHKICSKQICCIYKICFYDFVILFYWKWYEYLYHNTIFECDCFHHAPRTSTNCHQFSIRWSTAKMIPAIKRKTDIKKDFSTPPTILFFGDWNLLLMDLYKWLPIVCVLN